MSMTVPSEHPDHEGSVWTLSPLSSGQVHVSHSATLDNFTVDSREEAESAIAAAEQDYKGEGPAEKPEEPRPHDETPA